MNLWIVVFESGTHSKWNEISHSLCIHTDTHTYKERNTKRIDAGVGNGGGGFSAGSASTVLRADEKKTGWIVWSDTLYEMQYAHKLWIETYRNVSQSQLKMFHQSENSHGIKPTIFKPNSVGIAALLNIGQRHHQQHQYQNQIRTFQTTNTYIDVCINVVVNLQVWPQIFPSTHICYYPERAIILAWMPAFPLSSAAQHSYSHISQVLTSE